MQQDNPKWIVLCAFEINYFPGALYFSAIFTAWDAGPLIWIASQILIFLSAPVASVASLTPAACSKVPSKTTIKS